MRHCSPLLALVVVPGLLSGCPPPNGGDDGGADGGHDRVGQWSVLHGNQARTDCVDTVGVSGEPEIVFDRRNAEPSAFSGPVIGPVDQAEYGVPYVLYRTRGPGPSGGFHPPEGIEQVFGTVSRHPLPQNL